MILKTWKSQKVRDHVRLISVQINDMSNLRIGKNIISNMVKKRARERKDNKFYLKTVNSTLKVPVGQSGR